MNDNRLPPNPVQRIDRARRVCFTFDGRPFAAFDGDTVGSALYAAGVRIFSRSFKYHRPRGLLCCAGHCPNCLMNVDGVPNVRACVEPVREGLQARSQHAWPSLKRDVLRVFDKLDWLLPVGFYYKTFIHPRRLWPVYERVLRTCAGLGDLAGSDEPPGHYEREHLFVDVAVIGGGPAGMAAALEAARAGANVALVEADPRLGGHLLWRSSRNAPNARSGSEIGADLSADVVAEPRVHVLTGATAFGLYEGGLLGVMRDRTLIKLRAGAVVVATGGYEYPALFENNDLPGVMLGSGARRLQALYGVRPAVTAIIAGNDDRGLDLALDLLDAGVQIAAVVDPRSDILAPSSERLRQAGVPILRGQTVLRASGRGRVRAALVGEVGGTSGREIACDAICFTTGFEPFAGLLGQAGGKLTVDVAGRLVPTALPPRVFAGGEVAGVAALEAIIASGRLAGVQAALAVQPDDGRLAARLHELRDDLPHASGVPSSAPPVAPRTVGKQFVCLCEDVTGKDVRQAVAEGFDHIETMKRYTTVTMGPCQGKMCHRLAIDLTAALTGRTVEMTGTTTARPPTQPVPLGALAARHETPIKRTPMHHQHVALGAALMDMGPWKRPFVYSSIEEECRAVHEAVGIIDVSTLGKLDLKGGEAGAFLDWLHPSRFSDMAPGRIRYRLMCDDAGIVLDDGVVARLGEDHFLLTTTTGTIDEIEQWFEWWLAGTRRCAHVTNVTGAVAAINVAGPRARDLLEPLTDLDLTREAFPYMTCRAGLVAGVKSTLLRIGFVGELGYEIHCQADSGEYLWETLLTRGAALGVRPFGVESQRILRLEKQHVIVSQDSDALTNPFDINFGALVKLDKADFIGRDAIGAAADRPRVQQLVGFTLAGSRAPEEGAAVVAEGWPIGRVSSAKWSPYLGRVVGMALVPPALAREGATFTVRLNGATADATVVTRPFYDPDGRRLRS